MQVKELIEDMVMSTVKGLCTTCTHADSCIYHKTTTKEIIQCEMFELNMGYHVHEHPVKGLCKTCDNAATCKLSGRIEGVWHCNEFQ